MFKDILVHVDASDQGERRFDAATAFAGAVDSRLSALYVIEPTPAALYATGMAPVAGAGVVDARLHEQMLKSLEEERDVVDASWPNTRRGARAAIHEGSGKFRPGP